MSLDQDGVIQILDARTWHRHERAARGLEAAISAADIKRDAD
jgi:hypothetical protein